MGSHCIIRYGSAFFAQIQIALADFEEYLDVPAFSINADDLVFAQTYVCGNEAEIFVSFVLVADINHFCRNDFSILYNVYLDGEQISGTPTPFLVLAVNSGQWHIFAVIPEEHFGRFLYHCNHIISDFFDRMKRAWRGKPAVKKNVFSWDISLFS